MKSLKKWLLVLSMAGPAVLNLSCPGTFMRQVRDAALSGAADFVEQAAFDLLDQNIPLGD